MEEHEWRHSWREGRRRGMERGKGAGLESSSEEVEGTVVWIWSKYNHRRMQRDLES